MPHHKGVLVASLLLIACLGTNMAAFPEVWKMFRNDSPSVVAAAPQALPNPAPKPEKTPVVPAKTTSSDKPIPVEPPVPKKEVSTSKTAETPPKPEPVKEAPKPVPVKEVPKPVPVKEAPKPVPVKEAPKPVPAKEEPKPVPAKEEPKPEPVKEASKPLPVKEAPKPEPVKEEPKPVSAPSESQGGEAKPQEDAAKSQSEAVKAFAPIIPPELQDSKELESLLPTMETDDPFAAATPPVAPLYAEEFKQPLNEEAKRPEPLFETIDSALTRPIVYESLPTIDQRVEGKRKIVPLPAPAAASLKPLATLSPTGPVKRLPQVK